MTYLDLSVIRCSLSPGKSPGGLTRCIHYLCGDGHNIILTSNVVDFHMQLNAILSASQNVVKLNGILYLDPHDKFLMPNNDL